MATWWLGVQLKTSGEATAAFTCPWDGRATMRDEVKSSSKEMSLLQTMVPGAAAQSSAAAVLFGSAVPKGKESHSPKAMARQTGESQPLAWAGGSSAGPSLADKSSRVLEAWVCCRFLVCSPKKSFTMEKAVSARAKRCRRGYVTSRLRFPALQFVIHGEGFPGMSPGSDVKP